MFQVHHSQRKVDHTRLYEAQIEGVTSSSTCCYAHHVNGYHHLSAEIMWVRSILLYSDFVLSCRENESQWLLSMLRAVKHLDPEWRSIYFWGDTFSL